MSWPLWKKAIRESSVLFASCALVLYAFCWFRVWVTSRLEMAQFKNILESIPESWQRLIPVPIEQLLSYEGRIAVTFEEPVVYLMMAIWAIARSSDAVSGAVGRGTMEMLLAQPVSRKNVLLTHTSVTLLGVFLLAAVGYAGIYTGIATTTALVDSPPARVPLFGIQIPLTGGPPEEKPMSTLVDARVLLPATVNYLSLGVFLVGLTTMLSSWDRYRWRTIGLTVGFYVVETILELVGLAVEGLEWVKALTFFSAYEPVRFVSESLQDPDRSWAFFLVDEAGGWSGLGPVGCDALLIGFGAIGIVAALFIFCRRDLPAPL